MAKDPKDCPCGSGSRYAQCCRPLHRREQLAGNPGALMRARFSAFAVGEVAFLADTFHPSHPDAQRPREELLRSLRQTCAGHTFPRLRVLAERMVPDAAPASGRVLFHAEVFERGKDRSFVEASDFEQVEGAWRYLGGQLLPARALAGSLERLDFDGFARAVAASGQSPAPVDPAER